MALWLCQCGSKAVWLCFSAVLRLCIGNYDVLERAFTRYGVIVAVWLYDCVALCQCGNVAFWLCVRWAVFGFVDLWIFVSVVVWLCGFVSVCQCDCAVLWLCGFEALCQ